MVIVGEGFFSLSAFYFRSVVVGRFQPTKQDKTKFRTALQRAAAGHLPVRMWLFYEFLVHHGDLEGNPRLDKNLFFYCEVLKFKVSAVVLTFTRLLPSIWTKPLKGKGAVLHWSVGGGVLISIS